jgi:hypothetical protein
VTSAEVVTADASHALLRTTARASARLTEPCTGSRGFGGAPPAANLPAEGDLIDGIMRIDLLHGEAFRVRHSESSEVPANDTPMVTTNWRMNWNPC